MLTGKTKINIPYPQCNFPLIEERFYSCFIFPIHKVGVYNVFMFELNIFMGCAVFCMFFVTAEQVDKTRSDGTQNRTLSFSSFHTQTNHPSYNKNLHNKKS